MDVKYLRAKYIDMLTLYTTKEVAASKENDRFQDELCRFESNPNYRLKMTTPTIIKLEELAASEKLGPDDYRWLRDTWLY